MSQLRVGHNMRVAWLLACALGCSSPSTSTDAGPPTGCSVDGWCWSNRSPQGNALNAVWGSGTNDAWAVGDAGTILHWDGHAWIQIPSTTPRALLAVSGSAPDNVWAVGAVGTI